MGIAMELFHFLKKKKKKNEMEKLWAVVLGVLETLLEPMTFERLIFTNEKIQEVCGAGGLLGDEEGGGI